MDLGKLGLSAMERARQATAVNEAVAAHSLALLPLLRNKQVSIPFIPIMGREQSLGRVQGESLWTVTFEKRPGAIEQ